jgi:hypothetical protein
MYLPRLVWHCIFWDVWTFLPKALRMKEPRVERVANGYRWDWPTSMVSIKRVGLVQHTSSTFRKTHISTRIPSVGRSPPYVMTFAIFVILCVPASLTDNFGSFCFVRFLMGFFGKAPRPPPSQETNSDEKAHRH